MVHQNRTSIKLKEFFRTLYQKKIVRGIVYTFLILGAPVIGFYMHFIEPRLVKITRIKIPIKKLSSNIDSFRIVQISDLHFGPTNYAPDFFKKCVQKINDLKPDLIALTGDFMQWDSGFAKELAHLLSTLRSQHGTIAILGNHDYGVCHPGHPATDPVNHQEVIDAFEGQNIKVLHNESVFLGEHGNGLHVVGIGDFWTEHFKPHIAFENLTDTFHPIIVLSHNPDTVDPLKDYSFDLMLSGHVHGGQISFPFIGPLVVPVKHRHLRRGLHWVHDRWLYTNRGLGFIFKARLLSPPEIACLDLVRSL